MSITDLIADQLTVIRNAIRAGKKTVIIKRSGLIEGILNIAKKEGFVDNYRVIEDSRQGEIKVYLKYLDDKTSALSSLERVSSPGRRQYVSNDEIKSVMGGVGIAILSTNKGLLTGEEAKQLGVGGELICRIY